MSCYIPKKAQHSQVFGNTINQDNKGRGGEKKRKKKKTATI